MIKKLLTLLLTLWAAAVFASTEVNTATPAELDSVKGIGPAIAAKIVDERQKAPFKDWSDLVTRVKGIGDKNSARFSAAGLTVNGAALTGAPAMAAGAKKTPAKTASPATPATTAAVAPTPAIAATATPAASAAPAATPSAADKKAAAKQEREDKKAAKKAAKAASAASSASAKK